MKLIIAGYGKITNIQTTNYNYLSKELVMKKASITILITIIALNTFSQFKKEQKLNSIGISIPVIWNNSEATYYSLGNRKTPTGSAISYGLNINYSKLFYKGLFGKIGLGYFKQSFRIIRPFAYRSPIELLYSTETYHYNNIQLFAGVGYRKKINNEYRISGNVSYYYFNSNQQKYIVNKKYNTWQVNKKSFSIGQMINLNLGIERTISNKFSVGLDVILPLYTKWNNDEIFFKYDYSNDTQQIARNKFSIGTAISCYYHF